MNSKTKHVISIASLGLVTVLIALVIILAIIPTYKGVTFYNTDGTFTAADRPDIITVRTHSTKELQLHKDVEADSDIYEQIWSAYVQAGSYSVFNSLFIGISGKQPYAERLEKRSSAMSTLFDANDEYCLIFTWYDDQTIMNADGSVFQYTSGDHKYDADKYVRAYLSVTSANVINKTPVYLLDDSASFSSGTARFVYNGYFNTSALYQKLASLEYNNI